MNELTPQEIPNSEIAPKQKNTKKIILFAGSALVGISAGAGVLYATWAGYLPNPLIKPPTPEQMISVLQNINSAHATIHTTLAIEPRASEVVPLDFSIFQEKKSSRENENTLAQGMKILPGDLLIEAKATTAFERKDAKINEETNLHIAYTGNNITANTNITTRTIENNVYVKADAIPLPLPIFDFTALENTWITLNEEITPFNREKVFTDVFEEDASKYPQQEEGGPEKLLQMLSQEMLTLLQEGIKNGAITFSVPERITYNKNRAWQTNAVINGEELRETILALGEERETLFPESESYIIFTDDFLEATAKERAKEIYRDIFRRVSLTAITTNDGTPLSLKSSVLIAPKSTATELKERQIRLSSEISLSKINSPVNITAPDEFITLRHAVGRVMGKQNISEEHETQINTVLDLQAALEMYSWEHGEYPASLEDLKGFSDGYQKVTAIPPDIFTNAPYIYEKTETGYRLKFETKEASNDSSFYTTVIGTNTATELFLSEEVAKETDEDKDGISAYDEETKYFTDDYLTDSDFDGYSDADEISAGYNPAGEGLLM